MITLEQARSIALAFPHTEEAAHQGHPDFRVGGKVFASLRPEQRRSAAKVPADELEAIIAAHPEAFARNGWSHHGWIDIHLANVTAAEYHTVLETSWRLVAPKRLVTSVDHAD